MENPIPIHFTESQHALHAGFRLCGLYFRPVDFELMWEVQTKFAKNGNLSLHEIAKIETEIRGKYEADGVTLKITIPE